MSLYIVLIVIVGITFSFVANVEAAPVDHFGILLGKTCLTYHNNNLTYDTSCPTYEDLSLFFIDTSNQEVSGVLNYSENGFYERQPSLINNHYEWYRYHDDQQYLWIDPPADTLDRINRIIIEPRNFVYPVNKASGINDTAYDIGENRYVSSTCSYAIISAENWFQLLGDTLFFMKKDCDPSATNYNDTRTVTWDAVEHDIRTSKDWQYKELVKQTAIKCKETCFEHQIIPEIPTYLGQNFTLQLNETLNFSDGSNTNHTAPPPKPIDECELDEDSPLCEWQKYKQMKYEFDFKRWHKISLEMAGRM